MRIAMSLGYCPPTPAPVLFAGRYRFTATDPQKQSKLEQMFADNQAVRDKLSQMMYTRDRQRGELKDDMPLISSFFKLGNHLIGLSGADTLANIKFMLTNRGLDIEGMAQLGHPFSFILGKEKRQATEELQAYFRQHDQDPATFQEIPVKVV